MKIRNGRQSGTLDNTVTLTASTARSCAASPAVLHGITKARADAREHFAYFRLWRTLTDQQQPVGLLARRTRPGFGGDRRMHERLQLFIKLNCALAAAGLPRMMDPPNPAERGRNPVQGLTSRTAGPDQTRPEGRREPRPTCSCWGRRPCSAGISFRNNYVDHRPAARPGPRPL